MSAMMWCLLSTLLVFLWHQAAEANRRIPSAHPQAFLTPASQPASQPALLHSNGSGKPKLWLYWDAASAGNVSELKEAAEKLSVRTVYAQNSKDFDIHLVGKTSVHKFLSAFKLPKYFDRLPTNIQGDLASVALLAEHGGVYLDTDVIVFQSLLSLWKKTVNPNGPEFISMSRNGEKQPMFVHGFMGARPRSPLLKHLFDACIDFIKNRGKCQGDGCESLESYDKFGWSDMIYGVGYQTVADYMATPHGHAAFEIVGWDEQYTPQPWGTAALDIFKTTPTYKYAPPDNAFLVHWMHKMHQGAHDSDVGKLTEEDLKKRNCVFSTLVQKALDA